HLAARLRADDREPARPQRRPLGADVHGDLRRRDAAGPHGRRGRPHGRRVRVLRSPGVLRLSDGARLSRKALRRNMTTPKPFDDDRRVVLTLDAGGTSFRFTAIAGNREVAPVVTLATRGDDLAACLAQIVEGFSRVREEAGGAIAALSFAFPGPADYAAGVI